MRPHLQAVSIIGLISVTSAYAVNWRRSKPPRPRLPAEQQIRVIGLKNSQSRIRYLLAAGHTRQPGQSLHCRVEFCCKWTCPSRHTS